MLMNARRSCLAVIVDVEHVTIVMGRTLVAALLDTNWMVRDAIPDLAVHLNILIMAPWWAKDLCLEPTFPLIVIRDMSCMAYSHSHARPTGSGMERNRHAVVCCVMISETSHS